MRENLEFAKTYQYDTLKTGITLPIILKSGEDLIEITAKLDTGASFCIFERQHGELLNLDIESGEPITIGTATGSFRAFGHRLDIITFGLSWESTVYFIAEEGIKRNVLGRTGWLDRVKLALLDYEGKLLLSSYHDEFWS
jgi:predicted aspartyl protease